MRESSWAPGQNCGRPRVSRPSSISMASPVSVVATVPAATTVGGRSCVVNSQVFDRGESSGLKAASSDPGETESIVPRHCRCRWAKPRLSSRRVSSTEEGARMSAVLRQRREVGRSEAAEVAARGQESKIEEGQV